MDIADMLLNKIIYWVDLQKKSAEKLNSLAAEVEEHKKNANISQVVGSSVSVGGSAALAVAGIVSICTGGLAIPFLVGAGAAASGLGLVTNLGSEIVSGVISGCTMKEAEEIAEAIENLEKGIQKLMKELKEEGQRKEEQARSCAGVSEDDYVVEQILRAMAKREKLHLHDSISLCSMMNALSKNTIFGEATLFSILQRSVLGASKFVLKTVAKNSAKKLASSSTTKAVGRIAGGAVGLAFSVPELIVDCINLEKCETEGSKHLRENARVIRTASEKMRRELEEMKKVFRRLAKVKDCIENTERSRADRKALIDFVMERCKDEVILQWLRENAASEAFFKLVDMFYFTKAKIDEEEKKNHSNTVDITFVAHGAIDSSTIPASCLLPLPTITDVVVYSPWNCYLGVDAAYGVATGRMVPKHRVFYCSEDDCKIPHKGHQPDKLPNEWNSMKKAGNQKIPNIILCPIKIPEDGAWKRHEFLENEHGKPGRNRIVIPFILPGKSNERVPFYVVSLALSVVLCFSRFDATLHLTACLGKGRRRIKLDENALKEQYACTIDHTVMTSSRDMLQQGRLFRAFKAMFG